MWTWRKIGTATAVIGIAITVLLIIVDQVVLPYIVATTDTVRVPSVIGMKVSAAEQTLTQLGLQVKDVRYQHNSQVAPGVVMSQLPTDGSTVKEGRRVYLTVSKGLETVYMPNLLGSNVSDARRALARAGLQLGSVNSIVSADYPPETIAWQSVSAGAPVPVDALVHIRISQGASLRIPYLVGLTIEEARAAVIAAGLEVGVITERSTKAFTSGTVITQEPPADSLVPGATQVNLILAR